MSDEEGPDDKVLCVAIKDPLNDGYADLADLPEHELAEVLEFFRTYKILEVGKQTEVHGWEGKDEGLKSITGSMDRFERKFGGGRRL